MAQKCSNFWYTVGPKETRAITRLAAVIFRGVFGVLQNPEKNARSMHVFVQFRVKNAKLHENMLTASVFFGVL